MDKKHKGAYGELIACAWLLRNGYEVFRNVSPHGYADIVAVKDGIATFIDVKTGRERKSDGKLLTLDNTRQKNIENVELKYLYVLNSGDCVLDPDPTTEVIYSNRECQRCGVSFYPTTTGRKYCSKECWHISFYGKPRPVHWKQKEYGRGPQAEDAAPLAENTE